MIKAKPNRSKNPGIRKDFEKPGPELQALIDQEVEKTRQAMAAIPEPMSGLGVKSLELIIENIASVVRNINFTIDNEIADFNDLIISRYMTGILKEYFAGEERVLKERLRRLAEDPAPEPTPEEKNNTVSTS